MNKIFSLIAQLEIEIDRSPKPKLSNGNKRVVDCDRVLDVIGDIKVTVPEEVRIAQSIYAQRDKIIQNAQEEAAAMLAVARKECEKLITKENVLQEARKRAKGIVERAESNADMLADGSRNYSDEILVDLQRYLREYIGIIEKNRAELQTVYVAQTVAQPEGYVNAPVPDAFINAAPIQIIQHTAPIEPQNVDAVPEKIEFEPVPQKHRHASQRFSTISQSYSSIDDTSEIGVIKKVDNKEKKAKSWYDRFDSILASSPDLDS